MPMLDSFLQFPSSYSDDVASKNELSKMVVLIVIFVVSFRSCSH